MSDEKPHATPQGININIDPDMVKGVHGQDILISVTNKDVCLNFYVRDPSGKQGFVTARVFIPHTTAIELAELLQKLLGGTYKQYLEITKKLPPVSGETNS